LAPAADPPTNAELFDALAEEHGLYLLLTPYDTFWQSHNWENYPYNAAVGGSAVASASASTTSTASTSATGRLLGR